ncbi:serine protease 1-like [Phyllopteryx taeniolatus]|uniref:serine protease 1-like n=1 Tax=Phyllopteryx taeniolatus TaxID=161469 RepID=UPI002AD4E8BA|nr:serine protease 1-like [Phyllopteryx taeniolatus]
MRIIDFLMGVSMLRAVYQGSDTLTLVVCTPFNHKMEFCRLSFLLLAVLVPGGGGQLNVCGIAENNPRIVGGDTAPQGAWPWQGSLHRNGFHTCGASLINDQWVLCAAHCFPTPFISNLLIYLGRQNQEGSNANEQVREVAQLIGHEDYNPITNDNDIALLRLSSPVVFTTFIRPVCLATPGSDVTVGTESWVTGWGSIGTSVPLPSPQALQEVTVPVISNSDCNDAYGIITSNMICAGIPEGGRDSCQGDSGGPLVSKNDTRWVQFGVVSFGRGCALPDFPGVYARVSQYQTWITDRISGDMPGFVDFVPGTTTTDGGVAGFPSAPLLLALLLSSFTALLLM